MMRRWRRGRDTYATSLKLEARVPVPVFDALRAAGHHTEPVPGFASIVGHAGAPVLHPNGAMGGAHDPRSDDLGAAV